MNRILHDANNAQRILKLTADTMLLVDRHGVCVDIEPHCDLWFLQEDILLGKNIFELLPEYTRERVMPIFQIVLEEQRSISKNFKLVLKGETFTSNASCSLMTVWCFANIATSRKEAT